MATKKILHHNAIHFNDYVVDTILIFYSYIKILTN